MITKDFPWRLEDTMYLAMFAMEEAKHTEMFRRWFDAVGLDPASLDDLVRQRNEALRQQRTGIFDGVLSRVMRRLDTDQSPQAILDASIIYNQLVEGVLAIAGYQRWEKTFRRLEKLPGLEAGLKLTQRDERRHIAHGTYLGRRVLAENPELWEWLEKRWAKLTAGFSNSGGYGAPSSQNTEPENTEPENEAQREDAEIMEQYERLSKRRLAALAVARTMNVAEVDKSAIEAFGPAELAHV